MHIFLALSSVEAIVVTSSTTPPAHCQAPYQLHHTTIALSDITVNYVTNMMVNNHHLLIDVTQGAIQASALLNVVFGRKPTVRNVSVWRSHQQALYELSFQAEKGKPYSKLSSMSSCRL
jgi:hypothetical protein